MSTTPRAAAAAAFTAPTARSTVAGSPALLTGVERGAATSAGARRTTSAGGMRVRDGDAPPCPGATTGPSGRVAGLLADGMCSGPPAGCGTSASRPGRTQGLTRLG